MKMVISVLILVLLFTVYSRTKEDRHSKQALVIGNLGDNYERWNTNVTVSNVENSIRNILKDDSASISKIGDHLLLLTTRGDKYLLCWNREISANDLDAWLIVIAASKADQISLNNSTVRNTYLVSFPPGGCSWLKSDVPIVPGCIGGKYVHGWHKEIKYSAEAVSNLFASYPGVTFAVTNEQVVLSDTY